MAKTSDQKIDPGPLVDRLWVIGAKVQGIGFLLKNQEPSAEPSGGDINFGIGEILLDLGRELELIRERFEGTYRGNSSL